MLSISSLNAYSKASQVKFQRINIENGLSQSDVNDLLQDDLGFMWFATQYGLNRFDGKSYDYFYQGMPNQTSLSANDVTRMLKAPGDRIWLQTSYGLDSINQKSLQIENWADIVFKPLIEKGLLKQHNRGTISDLQANSKYLFALVNFKFVVKVDLESRSAELMDFKTKKKGSVIGIVLLESNELVLFGNKCFDFYDTNSFQSTRKHCSKFDLVNYRFGAGTHQNDKLNLSYDSGLYVLDLNSFEEEILEVMDSRTLSVQNADTSLEVDNGYWIGTIAGLKFYDKRLRKITREYWHNPLDPFSLSNDGVTRIFQADDGVIWIASHFGVNMLRPKQSFQHLLRKTETETFKLSNASTAIVEDSKNNLWVGTYNSGLYKYNSNRSILESYLRLGKEESSDLLSYVSKVFEDNNQNLFVLSGGGLSIKHRDSERFKTLQSISIENQEFVFSEMFDLVQDRYSNFWAGSADGLFRITFGYNSDGSVNFNEIFVVNYKDKLPENYLKSDYPVYVLYEDLQGYIWIGGTNGIVRFNPINLKVEHYIHDSNNFSSLSSSDITNIFEDNNGVLWIGTTNGLNRVIYNDAGDVRFRRIGVNDGFVSNYISSMQVDERGFLWISTLKGIVKYHPGNAEPVKNYLYEQGLQHSEFYTKSSYKDAKGIIYFGGVNGITAFNPETLDTDLIKYPIKFSSAIQTGNYLAISEDLDLQLENDDPIKIKVSNFDYISNRRFNIRYRIKGFSDWVQLNTQEIVLHKTSNPVILQVQQQSPTGTWINPGVELNIIPKAKILNNNFLFPLTILLSVLLLAIVLYWLILTLNRQKKEQKLILKREKAKQSLLMEEKLSLLHQVEDLHYSLSEQKYLVDKVSNELEQLNIKDELTNLFSRSYIIKNIQFELDTILTSWATEGQKGIYLGVFCVEIDNFSTVKELYGVIASNEILVQVAESIESICYGSDIIARWQGNSILILSRGISQREQMVMSEKIRNIIASRKFDLSNGKTVDITVSIGFSRYPFLNGTELNKSFTWPKLIFLTETALSSAKKNSLNAWIGIYSNQFTNADALNKKLFNELPKLFNSGQLDYVSSIPKSKKINWT